MVVGDALPVLVHRAAQDGVCQWVARTLHLPAAEDEVVGQLGRHNGVEHHGQVAAGGVLHANRHVAAAGHQAVELVFHGAGAHGHVGHQIRKIAHVFRVEHLIRGGEARLPHHPHVHVADCQNTLEHVRFLLRVRLMDHTHVALAGGPGFIGVNSGNNDQTVFCFFLNLDQPGRIVHHRVLVVCGTGADEHDKLIAFPCQYVFDFLIPLKLGFRQVRRQGKLLADHIRRGQLIDKCESHLSCTSIPVSYIVRI